MYFDCFLQRYFINCLPVPTTFIIMSIYFKGISNIIKQIKNCNVYIPDQLNSELARDYPDIYQNFRIDIDNAPESGLGLLNKYNRINYGFTLGVKNLLVCLKV